MLWGDLTGAVNKQFPKSGTHQRGCVVEILLLESHGYDVRKKVYKNSARVIIRGVGYYSCGSDVFNSFGPELQALVDPSVYKEAGKRQLMRLAFCRKEMDIDRLMLPTYWMPN